MVVVTLRVQVPNNQILTPNQYYNYIITQIPSTQLSGTWTLRVTCAGQGMDPGRTCSCIYLEFILFLLTHRSHQEGVLNRISMLASEGERESEFKFFGRSRYHRNMAPNASTPTLAAAPAQWGAMPQSGALLGPPTHGHAPAPGG